jgi:CRISPR-associated protein Cas1
MHELLNTLYVLTQGAVLNLESDTVRIRVEGETVLRVPLIRLDAIVAFGRVSITPFLIQRCAADGRGLVWMDRRGRFAARAEGPMRGNVLLRRAQHLAHSDPSQPWRIARQVVAGKVQNSRSQLLRAARDSRQDNVRSALRQSAEKLASGLERLRDADDLEVIRGEEGYAARVYFGSFDEMIRGDIETFGFDRRTRRPPRNPTNAVLSFLYALLQSECAGAAEGVGLDPQIGYLHGLRPGRPALALDLMEELRPLVADRLCLTLINRRQLNANHFEQLPAGAVYLNETGRRAVIEAYQRRKGTEITHRVLKRKIPLGLVPHVQVRLLARNLRGDLREYPPFLTS